MQQEDCLFCKIVSGEIPAKKLLETTKVLAFHDLHPSAETHVLVVPKEHLGTFLDLTDDDLLSEMRQAIQQVINTLGLSGAYRLVINGGKYQHVPHLHWHILGGELQQPTP